MMKRLRYSLLAILALFTLTVSCVDPLEPVPVNQSSIPGDALVFSPKVLGITPATKTTPGDADRGENAVTRLDVYVYKTTGGTVTFHKHYTIGDGSAEIQTNVDHLLESNWRLNYTTTDTYRIYAIANINANKLNNPALPESPTEAELLSLTSESDNQYAGQYGYDCYDIVRLMDDGKHKPFPDGTASDSELRMNHHTDNKLFLMDGKIDNWQVNPAAAKQYFTKEQDLSYPLSRAAAKFRVKLDFSSDFKESLGKADETGLKFTEVLEYYPLQEGQTEDQKQPKTVKIITIGAIEKNTDNKVYANGNVTGGARAKFANILKATYDIAPPAEPSTTTTPTAAQLTDFRDANLWDSQNFYEFSYRTLRNAEDINSGYRYPYIDTTYSYAFSWEPGQAAEKAPALAVSIVYTTYIQKYNEDGTFDGEAESDGGITNYYRIPLVDITKTGANAVNEVKRNYYYQVDALINTMGTSTTEIEPTKVNLKYKVIPWPDAPDEKTEAQTVQLLYFVPEKEYRLRGDGQQFKDLQYFTPKSDPNTSGHYAATPVLRNIRVYYYDQNGNEQVLQTAASGGYNWTGNNTSGVSIQVFSNPSGGGRFRVTSTALASRAVKYIEFDAVVDFSYTDGPTVTQHIVVTHFPLDNIQNILGSWSSRWDGQPYGGGGERTVYYRKVFYKQTLTPVQLTGANAQRDWAEGIGTSNADRIAANSAATAVNGYYATGAGPEQTVTIRRRDITNTNNRSILSITGYSWNNTNNRRVTISGTRTNNNQGTTTTNWTYTINNNNYDFVVSATVNNPGDNNNTVTVILRKYSSYWRLDVDEASSYSPTGPDGSWTSYDRWEWEECAESEYNATTAENRKTETVAVPNDPGTGDWVVRGGGGNHTYTDYGGGRDGATTGQFFAKMYDSGIYRMTAAGARGSNETHLNNPHMYVIQISKAEEGINLGRPRVNENYQSQDHVVSPAFMIASQLGAIQTSFLINNNPTQSGLDAARHCGTYMEVADNGRRFVGWRLPTEEEIQYIIDYQSNTAVINAGVFAEVLTAQYYFTLDGDRASTRATNGLSMVRCVRDLSPEEVIELNNTGTITRATY